MPHFIRPILEKQSGKTSFAFIRNHYGYQTYYHSRSWCMVKCLLLGKRDFGLYAKGYKIRAVENSLESPEKDTDNTIRLIGAHPDRSFWSDMITAALSSPEPATKTTSSALFIVRLIPSMKPEPWSKLNQGRAYKRSLFCEGRICKLSSHYRCKHQCEIRSDRQACGGNRAYP